MLQEPNRVSINASNDEIERLSNYCLGAVITNEPFDSALRPMLGYWNSLGKRGKIPRLSDMPPDADAFRRLRREITEIDTRGDNPENFKIVRHRPGNIRKLITDLDRKSLSEFPCSFVSESLIREYSQVCQSGVPRYQEIDQAVCGVARHYMRLMLPLSDHLNRVCHVMTAIRVVSEPYILQRKIIKNID